MNNLNKNIYSANINKCRTRFTKKVDSGKVSVKDAEKGEKRIKNKLSVTKDYPAVCSKESISTKRVRNTSTGTMRMENCQNPRKASLPNKKLMKPLSR